jgi:hypothetical protein
MPVVAGWDSGGAGLSVQQNAPSSCCCPSQLAASESADLAVIRQTENDLNLEADQ